MLKGTAILSAFAFISCASAQVVTSAAPAPATSTPTFSTAWKAAWPSSDQTNPVTFNPAWQADFDSIVFTGTALAPIVPSASVGKNNANFCDWSYNLCNGTNDIWQCSAPMQWGLTFDDGPIAPQSSTLYDFLATNNVKATHFMIGSNMVQWPELVYKAFQQGNQIAVHTWTHHAMTTLDNKTAYAELRWAQEIIKNITGYTPAMWRPPYGDVDDRIRNIAAHLGMTTVLWNQDTNDWCIGDTTDAQCKSFVADSVHTNLETWSTNQKANAGGLVVLEHELSNGSVAQFIEAFPTMKANGWTVEAVGTCNNRPFYKESVNATSSVASSMPATSAAATSTAAAAGAGAGAGAGASGSGAAASPSAKASSAASLSYSFGLAVIFTIAAFSQLL